MGSPEDHIAKASAATITLDVYSGRPNPSWQLTERETVELLRRLHALKPVAVEPAKNEGLGYRSVSAAMSDESNNSVVVTASRGVVTEQRAAARNFYEDPDRRFESWLVHTGEGTSQVSAELLRVVDGELAKRKP